MRWNPQPLGACLLGGCVALNPAYEDGRVGLGGDDGSKGDGSSTSADATRGTSTNGGSVTSAPTSTSTSTATDSGSSDVEDSGEDSSSGGGGMCPDNGFDMNVVGLSDCMGDSLFAAELCLRFSSTNGVADSLLGLASECDCGGGGLGLGEGVAITIAGHPLTDLVLQGELERCAVLRLSGVGNGEPECEVRSAFFFDAEPSSNLTVGFSNDIFLYPPLRQSLTDVGLQPVAEFDEEADCGGADPICKPSPGYYNIALDAGAFAPPDGEPVDVMLDPNRSVRLYNFASRLDDSCEEYGMWAAIWSELPYDFE